MKAMLKRHIQYRVRRAIVPICLAALLAVGFLAVGVAACSRQQPTAAPQSLAPPVVPDKQDLGSPDAAVRTYLQFTTLAYRMANSDVSSRVASPDEGVRIDSYIELNREKDRGLEQQLQSFTKRSESKEGTRVALAGKETWRYRYFSLSKKQYVTPMYTTSYETTYTLIHDASGWLVDKVDAKNLDPVY